MCKISHLIATVLLSCKWFYCWIVPTGKIIFTTTIFDLQDDLLIQPNHFTAPLFYSHPKMPILLLVSLFRILALLGRKQLFQGKKSIRIKKNYQDNVSLPNSSWAVKQSVEQVWMNSRNLNTRRLHFVKHWAIHPASSTVFMHGFNVKHTKEISRVEFSAKPSWVAKLFIPLIILTLCF